MHCPDGLPLDGTAWQPGFSSPPIFYLGFIAKVSTLLKTVWRTGHKGEGFKILPLLVALANILLSDTCK